MGMLDGGLEESPYFTLKTDALEAWERVKHLPKDERSEAVADHLHIVTKYDVIMPDEFTETPGVKALNKVWKVALEEERNGNDDTMEEDEKRGWWYEVEAQREKPDGDSPALEVEIEGDGTWWVTGFRQADLEGRRAMRTLVDYLAGDYY